MRLVVQLSRYSSASIAIQRVLPYLVSIDNWSFFHHLIRCPKWKIQIYIVMNVEEGNNFRPQQFNHLQLNVSLISCLPSLLSLSKIHSYSLNISFHDSWVHYEYELRWMEFNSEWNSRETFCSCSSLIGEISGKISRMLTWIFSCEEGKEMEQRRRWNTSVQSFDCLLFLFIQKQKVILMIRSPYVMQCPICSHPSIQRIMRYEYNDEILKIHEEKLMNYRWN